MSNNQFQIDEAQILIFDTGPLWELVLYSAVHDLGFSRLEPELRHLHNRDSYKKLSAFISHFRVKTTTSYVIAEISAWIRRSDKTGQARIWRLVFDEFSSMNMDEGILRLLEMPFALVADKGAVDASVLDLGRRLADRRPKILTVDAPLIAECNRNGLNAVDIWQVIAQE